MQKLTRVTLSTGEMAIYLDGWYLTSTGDGDHAQGLDDVVTGLLNMPGMRLEDIEAECPAQADWCWNDVAAGAGGREPAASAARWPPLQCLKDVAALHLSATVRPDVRPVAGRKCRALTVAGLARRQGFAVAVMLTRSPPCAGHSVRSGGACGLR